MNFKLNLSISKIKFNNIIILSHTGNNIMNFKLNLSKSEYLVFFARKANNMQEKRTVTHKLKSTMDNDFSAARGK